MTEHESNLKGKIVHSSGTDWLENSVFIKYSLDLLSGMPICYLGPCDDDGLRGPIFNLTFKNPSEGSCTNKTVPADT